MNPQLLLYKPSEQTNQFQFWTSPMSTLEALKLITDNTKLRTINFLASNHKDDFISDDDTKELKQINQFVEYFKNKDDFTFENFECELGSRIKISSHDDCEVEMNFSDREETDKTITLFLKQCNFPTSILETLKSNAGKYIELNPNGELQYIYNDFDEYLKSRHAHKLA